MKILDFPEIFGFSDTLRVLERAGERSERNSLCTDTELDHINSKKQLYGE